MKKHSDSHSKKDRKDNNTDFGRPLAAARKTKNHTVEEVSEYLKIPAQTITALEANDIESLPAPTFTQGYIRAYAKFLEISENELLAIYNRAVPRDDTSDLKPRTKLLDGANSQSPLIKAITALLIVALITALGFGGFRYYQKKADVIETARDAKQQHFTGNSLDSPGTHPIVIKQNAHLVDGELVLTGNNSPASTTEGAATQDGENTSTTENSERSAAENFNAETTAISAATSAATSEEKFETSEDVENSSDNIEIIAEKGSWVEVRDANKSRLFYNMLPAGGSRVFTGDAPFSVTVGNAKTTRVLVNNIEIDTSDYIRANNTASFDVSTQGQDIIFH